MSLGQVPLRRGNPVKVSLTITVNDTEGHTVCTKCGLLGDKNVPDLIVVHGKFYGDQRAVLSFIMRVSHLRHVFVSGLNHSVPPTAPTRSLTCPTMMISVNNVQDINGLRVHKSKTGDAMQDSYAEGERPKMC